MRREKLEKFKKRTIEILNTEVFSFKEAYWVVSTGAKFVYKNTKKLVQRTKETASKIVLKDKPKSQQKKQLRNLAKEKKEFKFEHPFKNFIKNEVNWNILNFKCIEVNFNTLKNTKVSIKRLGKSSVSVKKQECLHPDYIMTRKLSDFDQMVLWRDYLPGVSTKARLYDTGLYHQFNLKEQETIVSNAKINSLEKEEISIQSKARVSKEAIKIKSLTKSIDTKELYRFPMELQPCGIGFFSTTQLGEFKTLLANSQKTKPYNVEIVNVYDNFNIELYLKIMQSPNTNKFNCFLSPEKLKFNKFRQFYLVVGKRKDNNASITALYPKSQN